MRIEELKGKTITEARAELEKHTVSELKALCREHGAKGYSRATKNQLVDKVIDIAAYGLWLLELGTVRVEGNNAWIEYADGTTEVIKGEIPATAQSAGNKLHYVFEIGKKYAGKLNGIPTVFTVEDYEGDVIGLGAENGEFHSCVVNYFKEGAFGESDSVSAEGLNWRISVTARDIVEKQPAEEAQVETNPAPVQAEDAIDSKRIIKMLLEALAERKAKTVSQPEALYEDEAFSDALGDNSHPEEDIPECHTPDEFTAWTDEDFYYYFPNGEMTESELVELTLEELDALNEYLARKEAEMWKELDEIRANQKYPLVLVKKGNTTPEDMMLYSIGMYDSYEEMKNALDKNFDMVGRCKDGTEMRYLFYTCSLHTAYMMLKGRGYETRFEEWQSIKDKVVQDFIRQELARRESISQKRKASCELLKKYAENRAVQKAILDGVRFFRRGIEERTRAGATSESLIKAIAEVMEEYHKLRLESFRMWVKLKRLIGAAEIVRACKVYELKCREDQRRHCGE